MRFVLVLALVGATAHAAFRPEDVSRFKEKNEEKIKQAILEMESGNSSSSAESGERSDLAGMKRDPDDSIQKAAREHMKKREEEAKRREEDDSRMDKMLGAELEMNVQEGRKEGAFINGLAASTFDYLMFTMIYPTATCMADDDQVPGSCEIPAGTAQWTIHGLWPNYKDGSYPQFCDHQKFDQKQVQQLHEQMRTKWPNLFPKTPEAQLWSHEWEKHGTCSKSDPLLDSQFKYFNMSLFLLDHIDLRTRMEQKGISPRTAPYERDTLQKTLDEVIGHHVQMYCLQDKKTHESLLADIRVCMDAQLKPIDCPTTDIHPYVRAGTVTPDDHQPLPVPKKCSESIYYVSEGADISKSIDVLPPGQDSVETGKKLDTTVDKDDYYDDDDDEEVIKGRNKAEDEKARKLEEELMKALTIKTVNYQQNLHLHSQVPQLELTKGEIFSNRDSKITQMARKFHEDRARGGAWRTETVDKAVQTPSSLSPFTLWFCIGSLCIYLILIIGFFAAHSSGRQHYGRLAPA